MTPLLRCFAQCCTGNPLVYSLTRRHRNKNSVFILNYHATPEADISQMRQQIQFFQRDFEVFTFEEIEGHIQGSDATKPGMVLTFDDASLSNYLFAAPLLEEFNIRAVFLAPISYVDEATRLHYEGDEDNRMSMTWDELRDLRSRGHVIGGHSYNHVRLSELLTDEEIETEIVESKIRLESELDETLSIFCWVGGEEYAYAKKVSDRIRSAGYRIGLMTCCKSVDASDNRFQWHRFNIEASFSIARVRMVLGGMYQRMYAAKRRRVNAATAP